MNKKLIIFTDIGDTIIDESTEVRKEPFGFVYSAECIPGARETFLDLYEQGYRIVMVADGLERSFRNTMEENGLDHIFSEWVISEQLGVEKPSALMFAAAMQRMGLKDTDKQRVIMIGNNLARDIAGANRFGVRSVHMCWSDRYPAKASTPGEEPTWCIHHPEELLPLVERIEKQLEESGNAIIYPISGGHDL